MNAAYHRRRSHSPSAFPASPAAMFVPARWITRQESRSSQQLQTQLSGPGPELFALPHYFAAAKPIAKFELTVPVHSVGGHGGNVVLILLLVTGG